MSQRTVDVVAEGQPPIMLEEFERVDEIVKADPGWVRGDGPRGHHRPGPGPVRARSPPVTTAPRRGGPAHAAGAVLPAAPPGGPLLGAPGRRRRGLRRPDRAAGRQLDRRRAAAGAGRGGQLRRPGGTLGPPRTTLKPIEITQPEGPSFTVDGDVVTLGELALPGRLRRPRGPGAAPDLVHGWRPGRPIIYRASIAEMVVPYGDPSPVRFWQNYFDTGEYLLGQQANSLELGCDCLGEIHYFDAVLADERGDARDDRRTPSACTRRTSACSGSTPTCSPASPRCAAQRRLVISLLHHRRQLRLRLLLVPLPRRHDRAAR